MPGMLLVVGVVAAVAGMVMIGFGIPIQEFGLGNTLIISGTVLLIGGLVLAGLSDAVRQLRRIADGLMARPSPRIARSGPGSDAFVLRENGIEAGSPGIPFPAKRKPELGDRENARAPSFAAGLAAGETSAQRADEPPPASSLSEPRIYSGQDETPLSPRAPVDQGADSNLGRMDFAAERDEPKETVEQHDLLAAQRLDTATRPAPPAQTPNLFDSLWPSDRRRGDEEKAVSAEPGEAAEPALKAEADAMTEHPHAVSILKSGIIDEMAYTLYSDGSIEAELPQGTVRFASFAELRAYLEKSGE